jgi:hypothetical protein
LDNVRFIISPARIIEIVTKSMRDESEKADPPKALPTASA